MHTNAATVKTKISVDKLVTSIGAAADFSFDYMMLVVVASLLAGVGLATNNTVVIVASMLVSPLMGCVPLLCAWRFHVVRATRPPLTTCCRHYPCHCSLSASVATDLLVGADPSLAVRRSCGLL